MLKSGYATADRLRREAADRRPILGAFPDAIAPLLIPPLMALSSTWALLLFLGRTLEPAPYGGVAALAGAAFVLSVPAMLLGSAAGLPGGRSSTSLRWTAALAGAALVAAPGTAAALHVPVGTTFLVGPIVLLAAASGWVVHRLQLARQGAALTVAWIMGMAARLVSADLLHGGLAPESVVLLAILVGEGTASLAGVAAGRLWRRGLWPPPGETGVDAAARTPLGVAAFTLAAVAVLSQVDVLLARHHLPAEEAGTYAAARAIGWLVPLAAVAVIPILRLPVLREAGDPYRWLLRLAGALAGVLALAWGVVVLLREPMVETFFGPAFAPASGLVPSFAEGCALLGAVLVFASLHAAMDSRAYWLTVAVLVGEFAAVAFFHDGRGQVAAVAVTATAVGAFVQYQAAASICRWAPPLAALQPHEEIRSMASAPSVESPLHLSLVLPCHNAGPALREFLAKVMDELRGGPPHEVIVVSDGSTDDTVRIATEFPSENLRVFHYPHRAGKGHALRVGLNQARGEYVSFIDSDGDIDPAAVGPFLWIMKLYRPDIVLASKRHPLSQVSYPLLRRVMSWVYHKVARILFWVSVKDTQTGLKLIRKDVLAAVLPRMLEKRYAFDLELLVVARMLGFTRVFEAPVAISYQFTSHVNVGATIGILRDTAAIFYRRYILNTYGPAETRPVGETLRAEEPIEVVGRTERAPSGPSGDELPLHGPATMVAGGPLEAGRSIAVRVAAAIPAPVAVLAGAILTYVAVFGTLTWKQHANYSTFGFDMGIYDQAIWLLSRFETPFITVRGLHYFGFHFNLSTIFLVPFYWMGAGPIFLSLFQASAIAAGAIPVWLLARDRLQSAWPAVALAVSYLLFPSLNWNTWWHFHPDLLAVTPLLFAYWFATRGKWVGYWIAVVLALMAKEDVALTVFVLGLLVAWRYRRTTGVATSVLAVAWFLVAVRVIIPAFNPGSGPFYQDLFPQFGDSLGEIALNIARNPTEVLRLVTQPDRMDYYQQLLAPLAFVPLFAPSVLLLALPQALVNVLSGHPYTYQIRYYYTATISAVLFLATVEGVARLTRRPGGRRFLVGLVAATALAANVAWSPSPIGRHFHSGIWAVNPAPDQASKDRAVALVPPGASVSATYYLVPQLTHRAEIYEWTNPFRAANWGLRGENSPDPHTVEYLVLDTGLLGDSRELFAELTGPGGEYEVIHQEGRFVVAKRRPGT